MTILASTWSHTDLLSGMARDRRKAEHTPPVRAPLSRGERRYRIADTGKRTAQIPTSQSLPRAMDAMVTKDIPRLHRQPLCALRGLRARQAWVWEKLIGRTRTSTRTRTIWGEGTGSNDQCRRRGGRFARVTFNGWWCPRRSQADYRKNAQESEVPMHTCVRL